MLLALNNIDNFACVDKTSIKTHILNAKNVPVIDETYIVKHDLIKKHVEFN